MNNVFQLEDRVSRSRCKHEGESSADICDRLSRTRVSSQRQLPTDHDYAVPTREYQLDQSSPLSATAAADLVLEVRRQRQPQRFADIDRSHHINGRVDHNPTGTGLNSHASHYLKRRRQSLSARDLHQLDHALPIVLGIVDCLAVGCSAQTWLLAGGLLLQREDG